MSGSNETGPPEKPAPSSAGGRRCPTCGKLMVEAFQPFCSKRCADVDLNRWLSGAYAIPGEAIDPESPDLEQRAEGRSSEKD